MTDAQCRVAPGNGGCLLVPACCLVFDLRHMERIPQERLVRLGLQGPYLRAPQGILLPCKIKSSNTLISNSLMSYPPNYCCEACITDERLPSSQVFAQLAVPIASNSLVSNLANSMVTLIAGQMGSDVVAANAVVGGLWIMLWAIFWGFGCATQVGGSAF